VTAAETAVWTLALVPVVVMQAVVMQAVHPARDSGAGLALVSMVAMPMVTSAPETGETASRLPAAAPGS
jgi:hypothetical protein